MDYKAFGVWQQESGKGPRIANGAAAYSLTVIDNGFTVRLSVYV